MIPIRKGSGPESLIQYAKQGGSYDGNVSFQPIKQEIRESLCQEQGGICAFCMSRISPNANGMQIAHWKSQAAHPELACQYGNMVGSCSQPDTCNQAQKNHELKFNPTSTGNDISDLISYDADGTIHSSDQEFDCQLNQWLNLNSVNLRENRRQVYQKLAKFTRRAKGFEEKKKNWRRQWNYFHERHDGVLEPFCGVAFFYLKKHLHDLT